MKQNKPLQKLAAAAVVVLLTAACTQGEAEPGTETGAMVPLTIEASLTGELVQPATRTLINTEGAKIGVFLTNQGGYAPQYDKKYTYTKGAWKAAAEPVCVDAREGRVVAYYDPNNLNPLPANSFVTNPNALTAQLYADNKLWYYDDTQTNVTNVNPAIAFKMKPAYARVILSIQRHAASYVGVCAINNVTFSTNSQFISSGTIDISNSAVGGTPAAPWTINPPITGIAAGATNTACDVLLPPQPIANQGLTIALTVDGAVRTVTATPDKFPGSKLEPGKKYTIHLLITDTEVLPAGGVTSGDYGGDGTAIKNDTPKEI